MFDSKKMIIEHCIEKYNEYIDLYKKSNNLLYLGRANSYVEFLGYLSVIYTDYDLIRLSGDLVFTNALDNFNFNSNLLEEKYKRKELR